MNKQPYSIAKVSRMRGKLQNPFYREVNNIALIILCVLNVEVLCALCES